MYQMRRLNNIPEHLDAAYEGYTGAKKIHFPIKIDLDLSNYPDITQEFEKFKKELIEETNKNKKSVFGYPKIFKLFLQNFATGAPWDTKFLPQFPGRDIDGKTQYALYKGKIVSANYLSNNIFGQLCAATKIKKFFGEFISKIYSCGLLEPFINFKLPSKEVLKFRDPPQDLDAFRSGFNEYYKQNPWEINIDPSRPHPAFQMRRV